MKTKIYWSLFSSHKRSIRGPFRVFVLSSNESNKTKKKQCDSERKRMRRERTDIERERMQAYREMPVTHFISRDLVPSFSNSVCNFTGNTFPYHARGNSTIFYPQTFQASVKMNMACSCKPRRTLLWDSIFCFHPKEQRIFTLTRFSWVLGQPITFQSN